MSSVTSVASVVFKRLVKKLNVRGPGSLIIREKSSLWHPDYLEDAKSKYPEYPVVNFQIKGYDFPIVESYQRKMYWIAKQMDLDVSDAWAQELKKIKINRLKPKSDVVEAEYILKLYERNIQISNIYGYQMPIFMDLIMAACPPGVTVNVHPHENTHFESRFVPEIKMLELKKQLMELEQN